MEVLDYGWRLTAVYIKLSLSKVPVQALLLVMFTFTVSLALCVFCLIVLDLSKLLPLCDC